MSIRSLVDAGTKVWLDSIDPELVDSNKILGASGATSNPIIVSDLLGTGRFDRDMAHLFEKGLSDDDVAWAMTDLLVTRAQARFRDVWERSAFDDGWVSFELDPLLEDPAADLPHATRVRRYIELGRKWGTERDNRMIKVPATPAGLDALEDLCAAGLTLNVTLIFTQRQYELARDAVWRGTQRRGTREPFKSAYSIFVSRVDVYTARHVPTLSADAQGMVGIVNAKRLWKLNHDFWAEKKLPLKQEIIFASTGTKDPSLPADKYVAALAGSDIQTNPPATSAAVEKLGRRYVRQVDVMPSQVVLDEISAKVDQAQLEQVLMSEGVAKFADPHKQLLRTIRQKRADLA